jgi:hypothetical protein
VTEISKKTEKIKETPVFKSVGKIVSKKKSKKEKNWENPKKAKAIFWKKKDSSKE